MRIYSYNAEIKNISAQFLDSLNDIIVKRSDPNGIQQIKCYARLGTASNTFKFLRQPSPGTSVVVPVISTKLEGIVRDSDRVSGLNDYLIEMPDPRIMSDDQWIQYVNKLPGIPVNLRFSVDLFTVYQEELDQMITNLVAFCNPSYYIVSNHPKIEPRRLTDGRIFRVPLKTQVIWNGEINLSYPFEESEHPFRNMASTEFTIKTWIFPGDKEFPNIRTGEIKKINFFPEIYSVSHLDGHYPLSNFYPVPKGMHFSSFQQNIILGLIKKPFYDDMDISGKQFIFDAPTGLWSSISAMVSGNNIGDYIPVSGDATYLVTDSGDLLIFAAPDILNEFHEQVDLYDIMKQYEETGVVK